MQRTLLFGWDRGRRAVIDAEVPPGTEVEDLVHACARAVGADLEGDLAIWRVTPAGAARALDPAVAAEDAGVRSGDLIEVRSAGGVPPRTPRRKGMLELVVVGGPLSGASRPLAPGSHALGQRGGSESSRFPAPVLDVTEAGEVRLVPGEATGRVAVDGLPVDRSGAALPPGAWLQWGAGVFTVRAVMRTAPEIEPDLALRPPRVGEPERPAAPDLPTAPTRGPRSSVHVGVVLAPALVAVVVALVTRNPVYLLFGALAPLIGGWRLVADRRHGKRAYRTETRKYRYRLAQARADLTAVHAELLRARRAAMPDVASLVQRAVRNLPTVWERRPGDGDFLEVRVGVGDLASELSVVSREHRGVGAEATDEIGPITVEHDLDRCVPVTAELDGGAHLGVAGPARERRAVARMIALQVAVLHAPEDVGLAIVSARDRAGAGWDWTLLLPHVAAIDADAVGALAASWRDGSTSRRLVVVVDTDPSPPLEAALAAAAGAGVSVVWCAATRERLPRTCRHVLVVDSPSRARLTIEGEAAVEVVPDHAREADCLTAARALAARSDGARLPRGVLARVVGFRDAMAELARVDPTAPEAVASLWRDGAEQMRCLIGRGADGLVSVDLDADGPHALVVGTTGSGKSELFTTMLASLAVTASPQRLCFLLVDFKGGAAFDRLAELPHTAGVVTDLDGALAQRVLVSLEAELRRRMRILRELALPDLAAYERGPLRRDLPRLVVVVDEFAALSREVPGFVDGLVDVARRGRSLGVHLLVGTQQPDANTAKLSDNTNLRVCLRVQDAGVSRDVVGVGDAARFPREVRGRAIVARGHGDAVAVQTAWAGRARQEPDRLAVRVLRAGAIPSSHDPESAGAADGPSELDAVVDAIVRAWQDAGGDPKPHRVWVPPPSAALGLDDLEPGDPGAPVVGVADEAHLQRLSPMRLDLAAWGSVLAAGRSGSGRTALLRTVAAALARTGDGAEVAIYCLDCADGGLAPLAALPQCAAVVTATEAERIDRLFTVLTGELGRRAADPTSRLPAIALLLDGLGAFAAAHEDWTGGHVATLRRLCEDGRALGIHVVAAGDPVSIPGRVREAFGATVEVLGPGDAAGPAGVRWRVAAADAVSAGGGVEPARVPPIEALPVEVARSEVRAAGTEVGAGAAGGPILGLAADTMEPVRCELGRVPLFLVAGPMRSGRSTALATLALAIAEHAPSARSVLLAPRRGPLVDIGCWEAVGAGTDACASLAAALADEVGERADVDVATERRLLVVVVDDAEILGDGPAATSLDRIARRCWDADVWLLAAAEAHAAARSFGWLMQMRVSRHGIVLQAEPDVDSEVFRVRLPRRRGYVTRPGRGELVGGDVVRLVQVAR